MTELNVNIDHVATVRNARGGIYPNPVDIALMAENAGAKGIVCHLREDRRHIKDNDVYLLKEKIQTRLDLEMACSDEIIDIALEVKPFMVTIVPEKRMELTTEGGLDIISMENKLRDLVGRMKENEIQVSFFIEADPKQIELSHKIGADMVEIHTGHYADYFGAAKEIYLKRILHCIDYASNIGLKIAAGHGLNYDNVQPFANLENLKELSIGHSIISRSLYVGIESAVKEMINLIKG